MASLKKREKLLAGITSGLLLLFGLNYMVGGKKNDSSSPAKATTIIKSAATNLAKSFQPGGTIQTRALISHAVAAGLSWGRDPFAASYRLAQKDSSAVKDFTLRGIIWKGEQAHVLIGSEILAEGEQSGDLKVLDIQKNKVVCRKANKIITLRLEENEK